MPIKSNEKGFSPILFLLVLSLVIVIVVSLKNYLKSTDPQLTQKISDSKYKVAVQIGSFDYKLSPPKLTDVWLMNPDGSNKRQLTQTGNIYAIHDWSPDNKHIAVSLNVKQGDIYKIVNGVVDVGTGEVKILQNADPQTSGYSYNDPTWFSNDKLVQIGSESDYGIITTSIIDGKTEKFVTLPPKRFLEHPDNDIKNTILLSPDHHQVAFDTFPRNPYFTNKSDIYVYDITGKKERKLTYTGDVRIQTWNKDKIIFTRNNYEVWQINSDGSGLTKILEDKDPIEYSDNPGSIVNLRISRDGTYLLYDRYVGWDQYYLSHYTSGQKIMVVKQLFNDWPQNVTLAPDNSFITYAQRSGTHDGSTEPVVCFTRFMKDDFPVKTTTERCSYPSISN